MKQFSKVVVLFLLLIATLVLFDTNTLNGQVVVVGPAPVAYVPAVRYKRHHHSRYVPIAPIQVAAPAYYAPQVPLVPMAYGPVPTVSAYYVPTVPVVQTFYAPVAPSRKLRRHAPPVFPAVTYPVYWAPY